MTLVSDSASASELRVVAVRALFLMVSAVWLGGLMFYAGVVVPIGSGVLGGHRAFGFVTRSVTPWLNAIGSGVAVLLLVRLWLAGTPLARGLARWLWGSALGFAVVQTALWALHPWLDALLLLEPRSILDPDAFYLRHRIYLLVTAAGFVALVAHWVALLLGWRRRDRARVSE